MPTPSESAVIERLTEVQADVKHAIKAIEEMAESVRALHDWKAGSVDTPGVDIRLDRVERRLNDVPDLQVRIDRLETVNAMLRWALCIVAGAAITAVVAVIFDHISWK